MFKSKTNVLRQLCVFWVAALCMLGGTACNSIVTTAELRKDLRADKYQFIMLGDVHYDNIDYHTGEILAKQKSRIDRNLSHWNKKETDRTLNQWKIYAPGIIAAAAEKTSPDTLFAIQLGDITQGDAKSQEAQEYLFKEAIEAVTTPFLKHNLPMFIVKGNHDFRSPGNGAAFEATVVPYLKTQLPKNTFISGSNYSFCHGNDLFIFLDCENPDLDFVKRAINSIPKLRHLFILDHLPVLPQGPGGSPWTLYGNRQGKLQAHRGEFIKLLAKHNAIVLVGHIHTNSLTFYEKQPSERISQAALSSMLVTHEDYPVPTEGYDNAAIKKTRVKYSDYLDEFLPYITTHKRTPDGGYAVVTIDRDNVKIDYFHGVSDKSTLSWQLK